MLNDLKVSEFIDELASNSPAPGGGSVSALVASLASALNAMVFNLTVGKKAYNEYSDDIKEVINKSLQGTEQEKDTFIKLMEKDTEEFMVLMAAFKLPKNTEEEKSVRNDKIQEGYKRAIEVPYEVAKNAFKIYDYLEVACDYGNKNAISDAGVSALLAQAAIEGAVLNVKINLSSINDEDFNVKLGSHCDELISLGVKKRDEILNKVNSIIGV